MKMKTAIGMKRKRATLKIKIKNTGSEKAEAVDLRVIREAEQP